MNLRICFLRVIQVFALIIFFTAYIPSSFSSSLDSLIKERETLLLEYNELISTARTSPATDRKVYDMQNKIIAIDSFIIDDQFIGKAEGLKAAQDEVTKLEDDYETLLQLFYLVAGVGLLFLILFFLFLGLYIGAKKGKKMLMLRLNDAQRLLEAYKDDLYEISIDRDNYRKLAEESAEHAYKYKSQLGDYERRGSTNHVEMIRLKSENTKLNEELEHIKSNQISGKDNNVNEVINEEVSKQKNIIEEKNREIEVLNEQISEIKDQLNLSEIENNKKEEDEVALQNELDSLKKELLDRSIDNTDDEQHSNNLKAEIKMLRAENSELVELLEAAKQVQNDLTQEIQDAESVDEPQKGISLADSQEVDKLKKAFEEQTEEFFNSMKLIEDIKKEKKNLEYKNDLLEEEISKIRHNIKNFEKPAEENTESTPGKSQDNLMVEDLLQQNLDLQNELNEFKKLLDEELENREDLLIEIKELERFYKSNIQDEMAAKEFMSADKEETSGKEKVSESDYEILEHENAELKKNLELINQKVAEEEQARLELENELKELLNQFNASDDDLQIR
ncbi:MAG: hypothetical protein ACOCWC_00570 [Bacteroidota bacterium]